MAPLHSVYVIGEARTNADNAITKIYGSFFMAFEVEDGSHTILDFSCTHTLDLTEKFLRKLFVGSNFLDVDATLEQELLLRYSGTSRKAVLVAYRDALRHYKEISGE